MFPRRRPGRPPPMTDTGDDAPIELEVRVKPGTEQGALKEVRELGAEGDVVGRGELRVRPAGPLRPLLAAERALAFYAVRRLEGGTLRAVDQEALMRAAMGMAGVVANLQRGKLASYRVTAGPELADESQLVNQLTQRLGSRLGVPRALVQPDLVLVVRAVEGAIELAARLPRPGERRPAPVPSPDAPRGRATPPPRRSARR